MKRLIPVLAVLLVPVTSISAQDEILDSMIEQAEIIVHVEVIEVKGGVYNEIGVEECAALCSVVSAHKGSPQEGEMIRFHFNRFDFAGVQESYLVEEGKEYIVFLKGSSGGIRFPSDDEMHVAYTLLDRWVGVISYDFYLGNRLCW